MLLTRCGKCGVTLPEETSNMTKVTIEENGQLATIDVCQRCLVSINENQNNSNILFG